MSGSFLRGRVKFIGPAGKHEGECFSVIIEVLNIANRKIQVWNHDVQLWQAINGASRCFYLTSLLMHRNNDTWVEFGPKDVLDFEYLWHYSPSQLQEIEDRRKDQPPGLQLRATYLTSAIWSPERPAQTAWEHVFGCEPVAWPINNILSLDSWVQLLDRIGFQSTIAPHISVPPLPPAFNRSAKILAEGWKQHFSGDWLGALASSRMAIECLPFQLFETAGDLKSLVSRILLHVPEEKVKAINGLIVAVAELRHLACHEKSEPVPPQKTDSELALICTAAILKYLACHHQPL